MSKSFVTICNLKKKLVSFQIRQQLKLLMLVPNSLLNAPGITSVLLQHAQVNVTFDWHDIETQIITSPEAESHSLSIIS